MMTGYYLLGHLFFPLVYTHTFYIERSFCFACSPFFSCFIFPFLMIIRPTKKKKKIPGKRGIISTTPSAHHFLEGEVQFAWEPGYTRYSLPCKSHWDFDPHLKRKKKKKCSPPPARTTDKIFKVCASDNNNKPKGLWFKSSFRHLIWHSSHKKKKFKQKIISICEICSASLETKQVHP